MRPTLLFLLFWNVISTFCITQAAGLPGSGFIVPLSNVLPRAKASYQTISHQSTSDSAILDTNYPLTTLILPSPLTYTTTHDSDSTLIRLAFTLPPTFELDNPLPSAVSHLFNSLPSALAYGLSLNTTSIKIHALQRPTPPFSDPPFTLLSYLYIPTTSLPVLRSALNNPNSLLFQNKNTYQFLLISSLERKIPLTGALEIESSKAQADDKKRQTSGGIIGACAGAFVGCFVAAGMIIGGLLYWRRKKGAVEEGVEEEDVEKGKRGFDGWRKGGRKEVDELEILGMRDGAVSRKKLGVEELEQMKAEVKMVNLA